MEGRCLCRNGQREQATLPDLETAWLEQRDLASGAFRLRLSKRSTCFFNYLLPASFNAPTFSFNACCSLHSLPNACAGIVALCVVDILVALTAMEHCIYSWRDDEREQQRYCQAANYSYCERL